MAAKKVPGYLHHYTDESGKDGILDSKTINVSRRAQGDAFHGRGIYCGTPPSAPTEKIVHNNWDGARGAKKGDTEYCISVRTADIPDVKLVDKDRDVYKTKDAINLDDVKHRVKQRDF